MRIWEDIEHLKCHGYPFYPLLMSALGILLLDFLNDRLGALFALVCGNVIFCIVYAHPSYDIMLLFLIPRV